MKRALLMFLVACTSMMQAWAQTYVDDNQVTWGFKVLSEEERTASITSASGFGTEVTIPATVSDESGTYTVTELGENLFYSKNNIVRVTLPASVETVGEYVFYLCSNLQSIDLSACKSIGTNAFDGCASLRSVGSLSNCEVIGNGAFQSCSKLQSVDLPACKSIDGWAFSACSSLKSVGSLTRCESVGEYAFQACSNLQSIELSACKSIGDGAFVSCSILQSVGSLFSCGSIGNSAFASCQKLQSVGDLSNCETIGESAFLGCWALSSGLNLKKCKTIDDKAFAECYLMQTVNFTCLRTLGNFAFAKTNVQEVSLPETLESMGWGCFPDNGVILFKSVTPPVLAEDVSVEENIAGTMVKGLAFQTTTLVRVPEEGLSDYRAADVWSNHKDKMISLSRQVEWDVTNTALDDRAGLEEVVPTTEMSHVVSLKVSGTINGYDIFMIRTKMYNLHYLDLTDAEFVANPFEYVSGCHTEDNAVGARAFCSLPGLLSLKLPKGAKYIGSYAASDCSNLRELVLPEALGQIGYNAFQNCSKLKNIQFPPHLTWISSMSFDGCSSLQKLLLPALTRIQDYAFAYCSSLQEVRLPSSLQRIDDNAFLGCPLERVYTYTVEPTKIYQGTFNDNVYQTAELWMPTQSYTNYFYNTEWGQFRSENYRWFDEPYDYFYLNNDYTLSKDNSADKDKGRFDGEPDVDINPGAGLIVEGSETQPADEIHLKGDGSNWATIIANGNVDAKKLYFDIDVTAGHWYFLCFPFDVKRDNVHCDGSYVFRYYDGQERAENGSGGWKNLQSTEEYLRAGKGYIFQTSANGTLSILVEKEQFGQLAGSNVNCELEANASGNEQDASWNFVGNPFTSYFNMDDMGYDAPVTRWNSETGTYEAVRPGDDDCVFHPFEAFFVQRPADSDNIEFEADKRVTQTQGNAQAEASRQKRRMARLNPNRLMVNLSLGDGLHADKTRVVFNPQKSVTYELDCDAAKFESASAPVQLYSMEASAGRMAINERPVGSVRLGFTVAQAGEYTLSVLRMDQPVLLWDNETHMAYDLCNGDYTFSSQAGVHDDRFMLLVDGNATGVADVARETGVNIMSVEGGIHVTGIDGQTVNVYALAGILCATRTSDGLLTLPRGVYVVEVGDMRAKVMVK